MEFILVMREKNVLTMPASLWEWVTRWMEIPYYRNGEGQKFYMEMEINNSDILSLRYMQDILLVISSRFLAVYPDILLYPWNAVSFMLNFRYAFYLWYMKYEIFNGKKNPLCLERKKIVSKYYILAFLICIWERNISYSNCIFYNSKQNELTK